MNTGETRQGIAVFWDESFLWGIMACKALVNAGIPFQLVTAKEIAHGVLNHHLAVLVPGGWASNKFHALGETGVAQIRQFVHNGGTYIGFCGGAGLATNDGLQLINVTRVPTTQRVPSFSGRIRVTLTAHPLWNGIDNPVFHAWWPSQFATGEGITTLARYDEALPEAFSSDLNVGDILTSGGWGEWETHYGINLDPSRMNGLPGVVTSRYGQGNVFASLLHFDTPDDNNGMVVLRNLWKFIGGTEGFEIPCLESATGRDSSPVRLTEVSAPLDSLSAELCTAIDGLMELGHRNFLWFNREPSMLQWKRGVRGLEYFSLQVMFGEIRELIAGKDSSYLDSSRNESDQELQNLVSSVKEQLENISMILLPFISDARKLLILERQDMANHKLTYAEAGDPRVLSFRNRLFSSRKSYGGLYKEIADQLSNVLYSLITRKIYR
jgi:hypothetical protein